MSSSREAPEDQVDTSNVSGLEEVVPESLMPIWRRMEMIQSFREAHSDTYVTALEILTAIALTVGYAWWVYLYFSGAGASF